MKVLTIHDLKIIKKRAEGTLLLREESNETVAAQCCGLALGTEHLQILICGGTGCKASDSHIIAERLQQALERNNIADKVDIITTGCFGFCEKGPIVKIIPDNTFYTQVVPDDADEIVREHIIGGRKIERLLYIDPKTEKTVSDSTWISIGSRCASLCVTVVLSIPKTLRNILRWMAIWHWQIVCSIKSRRK